jgi:hypothetical protein
MGLLVVGIIVSRRPSDPDAREEALQRRLARTARGAPTAADSAFADSVVAALEQSPPDVRVVASALPAPERDPDRTERLLSRAQNTYIGELLTARDSVNFRWPDRRYEPMRVWVQPSTLAGFDPANTAIVRDAFTTWTDAGVPIALSFTPDSARAEIHVTWVDRFESRMTGRTRWAHDQHGWIVGGNIQLAIHQPNGTRVDADAVRAIARHEVGHLIGLDHTTDAANIMSARITVPELSEADRATARLIYQLPPGSLKRQEP